MGLKEDDKIFDSLTKCRVVCKCSHTVNIAKVDRLICNCCGNWVYRTPELEFKYKILEEMKRSKKNG